MGLTQLGHVLFRHPVQKDVDLGLVREALHSALLSRNSIGHQSIAMGVRWEHRVIELKVQRRTLTLPGGADSGPSL